MTKASSEENRGSRVRFPSSSGVQAFARCHLYTFVDAAYLCGRPAGLVAQQLCDGGADVVQVRAKGEPLDTVRRLVAEVKQVTDRHQVILVVNDYPEVALELGISAVHMGQEDFFGPGHRTVSEITGSPARFQLGLSTHSPDQAEKAVAAGPAYVAIGPIFATPTKPGRPAVTLEYVRWAAKNVTLPWFAIGGINLSNVQEVLAAGARRICVVSAILSAPDVTRACQAFRKCLEPVS